MAVGSKIMKRGSVKGKFTKEVDAITEGKTPKIDKKEADNNLCDLKAVDSNIRGQEYIELQRNWRGRQPKEAKKV